MSNSSFTQGLIEISQGKVPTLSPDFIKKVLKKTRKIVSEQDPAFEKQVSLTAAQLLLDEGADLNFQDPNNQNNTPIMNAIFAKNIDIFNFFISRQANLNLKNVFGQTVLHIACSSGNVDLVKILLAKGLSVHEEDQDNMLPLHYAINNSDIVVELLKSGAFINAKNATGETALHLAAKYHAPLDTLKTLIKWGADFTIKNHDQQTPLELAQEIHAFDSILFLMQQESALHTKSHELYVKDIAELKSCRQKPTPSFSYDLYREFIDRQDYNKLAKKTLGIRPENQERQTLRSS